MTLLYLSLPRIDDSKYPCHRYINRKGEFDIENQQINLVRRKRFLRQHGAH